MRGEGAKGLSVDGACGGGLGSTGCIGCGGGESRWGESGDAKLKGRGRKSQNKSRQIACSVPLSVRTCLAAVRAMVFLMVGIMMMMNLSTGAEGLIDVRTIIQQESTRPTHIDAHTLRIPSSHLALTLASQSPSPVPALCRPHRHPPLLIALTGEPTLQRRDQQQNKQNTQKRRKQKRREQQHHTHGWRRISSLCSCPLMLSCPFVLSRFVPFRVGCRSARRLSAKRSSSRPRRSTHRGCGHKDRDTNWCGEVCQLGSDHRTRCTRLECHSWSDALLHTPATVPHCPTSECAANTSAVASNEFTRSDTPHTGTVGGSTTSKLEYSGCR